jgi:hypothetical protein
MITNVNYNSDEPALSSAGRRKEGRRKEGRRKEGRRKEGRRKEGRRKEGRRKEGRRKEGEEEKKRGRSSFLPSFFATRGKVALESPMLARCDAHSHSLPRFGGKGDGLSRRLHAISLRINGVGRTTLFRK